MMKEKILVDLKNAMKNQNKELLSVIRMVKGAIQLEEIKVKHELNDEEVITIIAREIKTRKESIKEFEKGGRNDLIEKTSREIEILNKYMPAQMSEEEVMKIIDEVFSKVNPTGPSDMGKIMGTIAPLIKGKADLGFVNSKIKEKLNQL
ncbi:MAG: GatB/YqeY domain-containing protein [Firmicutes bacterium]|nr:GatB/YqeY domain-containing protein [Bacillota bacterium]